MIAARAGSQALRGAERLAWPWILALYLVPWVPLGPLVVIVGSSVAYYRLRRSRPALASQVNRHAFLAVGIVVVFIIAKRAMNF